MFIFWIKFGPRPQAPYQKKTTNFSALWSRREGRLVGRQADHTVAISSKSTKPTWEIASCGALISCIFVTWIKITYLQVGFVLCCSECCVCVYLPTHNILNQKYLSNLDEKLHFFSELHRTRLFSWFLLFDKLWPKTHFYPVQFHNIHQNPSQTSITCSNTGRGLTIPCWWGCGPQASDPESYNSLRIILSHRK